MTQRAGVRGPVQAFLFPSSGRASSMGTIPCPSPLHSPTLSLPGHSQENDLVSTATSLTLPSICSFLPSFHPSFDQHPCSALVRGWGCRGGQDRPCPQRAPSWDTPAALPFPAVQARIQVRPLGGRLAQDAQVWAGSPRRGNTQGHQERGSESDSQGAEENHRGRREGRQGEPEGHGGTDGLNSK